MGIEREISKLWSAIRCKQACLGISSNGDPDLFLNQQGQWVPAGGSTDCDAVSECLDSFPNSENSGYVLSTDGAGDFSWIPAGGNFWSLTGNAGTDPDVNFIGTSDNTRLTIRATGTDGYGVNIFGNGLAGKVGGIYLEGTSPADSEGIYLNAVSQESVGLKLDGNNVDGLSPDIVINPVNSRLQILNLGESVGYVLTSDASGNATWQAPTGDGLWIASGDDIYNSNIGNVGIGTTTPTGKLEVVNGTNSLLCYNSGFQFNVDGAATAQFSILGVAGGTGKFLYDPTTQTYSISEGGIFQYVDGNENAGYVLTSDSSGNASWAETGGQYWTTDGAGGTINTNSSKVTATAFAMTDGTEAMGYILTSDASGNATWQDLPISPTITETVDTTDNTPTTIATIPIPSDTALFIEAKVVARRTGGVAGSDQDSAGYQVNAVYKNIGGTATETGEASIFSAEDQAGWSVTFTPDGGGNALIQVTGAVDNNVSWKVVYTTYSI